MIIRSKIQKLAQKAVMCVLLLGLTVVKASAQLGLPPLIVVPPLNQTVLNDGTANFLVVATSLTPMTYKWKFNGSYISGATAASLSVTHCQYTNAGTYTVEVKNSSGTSTASATLSVVNTPLVIASFTKVPTGMQLYITGPLLSGATYVIQASTNLTSWTPISTNTPSLLEGLGGSVTYVDTTANSRPTRYYRVMLQQ